MILFKRQKLTEEEEGPRWKSNREGETGQERYRRREESGRKIVGRNFCRSNLRGDLLCYI